MNRLFPPTLGLQELACDIPCDFQGLGDSSALCYKTLYILGRSQIDTFRQTLHMNTDIELHNLDSNTRSGMKAPFALSFASVEGERLVEVIRRNSHRDYPAPTEDAVQSTDPKNLMFGDGNSVMRTGFCFQDYVTSLLIHFSVTPVAAKNLDQLAPAEVAGDQLLKAES